MSPTRIEIVSGPTCCGKSVYIETLAGRFDGLAFVGRTNFDDLAPASSHIVHYNVLRPFDAPRVQPGRIKTYWQAAGHHLRRLAAGGNVYRCDPALTDLVRRPFAFHATLLAAPRRVLLDRVGSRRSLEPLIDAVQDKQYEPDRWAAVYRAVDLADVFRGWIEFLRGRAIPFTLVDSSTADYRPIGDEGELFRLLDA